MNTPWFGLQASRENVRAAGPTSSLADHPHQKRAAAVGRFEDAWGRTYPRLQIITLAELFQGKKPDIPFVDPASVKRAKREDLSGRQQNTLL